MDKRIDKIKKMRQFVLEQIAGLTEEQLNKIPVGYKNNIIWNLTHLMATQQGVCYLRAAQPVIIPEKYFAPFLIYTKPERTIEGNEIEDIKRLFLITIDDLYADYNKKIFNNYTASPNVLKVYGIELSSVEDGLEFLLYHEGYHTSSILYLKKLVA